MFLIVFLGFSCFPDLATFVLKSLCGPEKISCFRSVLLFFLRLLKIARIFFGLREYPGNPNKTAPFEFETTASEFFRNEGAPIPAILPFFENRADVVRYEGAPILSEKTTKFARLSLGRFY